MRGVLVGSLSGKGTHPMTPVLTYDDTKALTEYLERVLDYRPRLMQDVTAIHRKCLQAVNDEGVLLKFLMAAFEHRSGVWTSRRDEWMDKLVETMIGEGVKNLRSNEYINTLNTLRLELNTTWEAMEVEQ